MPDFENQIQKLALGTVQFGMDYGISNKFGKTPFDVVGDILMLCKQNRIDTIDTAFGYGESEQVLGHFDLSEFKIISKFLDHYSSKGMCLDQQLEQSLAHLNLSNIYGYLAHRPLELTDRDWRCLQELKNAGIIKKVGFSFNQPKEIDILLDKGFIPDLVQAPFNYLDNRFSDKLKLLKENFNTEVHTRSSFLQGVLLMKPQELPVFFEPIKSALEEIENIKNKAGALLRYVLDQPFIDKVVIGVNQKQQLTQNLNQLKTAESLNHFNVVEYPEACLMPSNWPSI